MTVANQSRIQCIGVGALALCLCAAAFAQSDATASAPPHSVRIQSPPSGALSGRLTDLHSAPLAGLSILLRNQATGAELRATTGKNGGFRFASLDVGEYTLEADAPRLGHGQLEGIVVTGGIESRVQAAIRFEPAPPALLAAAAPDRIAPPPTAPPAQFLLPALAQTAQAPIASALQAVAPPAPPPQTVSLPAPLLAAALVPMRAMPIAPRSAPPLIAQPSSAHESPPALAPAPAASPASTQHTIQAPVQASALGESMALETESVPIDSALAIAVPHGLSVSPQTQPALLLSDVVVAAIQAAVLHSSASLGPVVAASQTPDPASPAVESTLTSAQLQALPVSGRRWQEFLLDTPAASASPDSFQPSFRGAGQLSPEITVEGASTHLAFGVVAGSSASPEASDPSSPEAGRQNSTNQGWPGGRGLGVSEAAIREVTATAGNAEAESMRAAGGLTAIRTESGTDALHGQGFFFDRQNTWGARNPFTQWVTKTSEFEPFAPFNNTQFPVFDNFQYSSVQPGQEPYTPPDHETVWGLGMGSHIRRDKLFWFAALDSYHRNDPAVSMVKHPYLVPSQVPPLCEAPPCPPTGFFAAPSDAQLQLLSAQLGLSSANPSVEGLTAYSQILGALAGLLGPAPRTAAQWLGFGRIDWQIAERHRLTLEGTGADWNSPGGGLTRVSENYGSSSFGSSYANEQWLLARWEAYLTPNLLAVTQASVGRDILSAKPDTPSTFEQTLLNGNFWGQLPEIVVDSRYGFTIGNPSRFGQGSYPDEKLYHGQEMLDWVRGKLLVRAGFELDHNADATSFLRNQTGTYVYSKVENFISDALVFQKFGFADALDPDNPHNCGATSTTLGSQPCYSYYSQMMGPANWHLSTNDWAGHTTAQWQAGKLAVFSIGLRWELEQMPPPIAALANPQLPFAGKSPSLDNNWGPRISLAVGQARSRWPVLRLGYGMYYGRVANATLETALTQTGSLKGDLYFFMRPQDDSQYGPGGAPPFPYVFVGEPSSAVKPGVVGFAHNFKNPEVHQAVAAIEQSLPDHVQLTAEAIMSLGRRLPISIDTNINTNISDNANSGYITYAVNDPTGLGPINTAQTTQIQVPFYASWPENPETPVPWTCPYYAQQDSSSSALPGRLCPDYQKISQITSLANSTYEAAMVKLTRYGSRGLSFHAHYTYAHAMDWNPDGVTLAPGSDVADPAHFNEEYGTSNLDVRHSAAVMATFEAPWKLRGPAGRIANGWMLSGIGQFHSGLPYTMRITGSIPTLFNPTIIGLGPTLNGSGGDNRFSSYKISLDGPTHFIPRNASRYPNTWKADLRLAKRFDLGEMRQLEVIAESFNLFNHQNVTEIETTGYYIEDGSPSEFPTLNFLTSTTSSGKVIPAFGQPLNINATDFYRERQIQLGLRFRF